MNSTMKSKSYWYSLIKEVFGYRPSTRRPELPVVAALAFGLPLLIGAAFGHLEYGLVSALGGMTFVYMQHTALMHRMLVLLCVATLMTGAFLCGLTVHHVPMLMVPMVFVLTFAVTLPVRFFQIPPPGTLFVVMVAMIGSSLPVPIVEIPYQVGLLYLGSLLACILALLYTLVLRGFRVPETPIPTPHGDVAVDAAEALILAFFVALSLLLAQLLQIPRPYWAPVSTLAVLQGVGLRSVWVKQLQRIVGTLVGLLVAWGLLQLHPGVWALCFILMGLTMVIETLVVRHYAAAVIFITPLTIFLAEVGTQMPVQAVIGARLWDTLLGSVMGLAGGFCLHQPALRLRLVHFWYRWVA